MIGDIPLAASGVGIQMKYIIDHLVKTGEYKITVFGGATKHPDYKPIRVQEWGEDVTIIPVDGYGNPDLLRQALDFEKPDAIWIVTDPRYYVWLFQMADEIHQQCPIIYWNIWDNADEVTWPKYNSPYYDACDALPAINKLTHKFLNENGWKDRAYYVPHGVPKDDFKILDEKERERCKIKHLGEERKDFFVGFYNSRNALRKRTGTVIMSWREFLLSLPEEERDKCVLCMKTPPHDPEGQNLHTIIRDIPDLKGRIAIVDGKFPNSVMGEFYNIADFTISLSSEEGFGLCVLESLMCGTPVICTKTGGMQDQIIDDETGDEFGFCLEPDARSLIGSQSTAYIWSDHVSIEKASQAISKIYSRRQEHSDHKNFWAGGRARESMLRRFSIEQMQEKMKKVIDETIEKFQSQKENQSIFLKVV